MHRKIVVLLQVVAGCAALALVAPSAATLLSQPTQSLNAQAFVDATASRGFNCFRPTASDPTTFAPKVAVRPEPRSKAFVANVCFGKVPVRMLVDTGQNDVILTWNQAVDLDLKPNLLAFDRRVVLDDQTVRAAAVTLPSMRIGDIVFRNVAGLVVHDDERRSGVIGKQVLTRLKEVRVNSSGWLVLVADAGKIGPL